MKAIKLSKWKGRQAELVIQAVCVAAAAPLLLESVNPLLRPRAAMAVRKAKLEQLEQTADRLAGSVERHRQRLAELTRTLKQQDVRLEPVNRNNSRIARLTDLVESAGLSVDQIRPEKPIRTPRHQVVPIHVTGAGSYPTCAAFLRKLAETFPDTSVNSFRLSCDLEAKAPARFGFRLHWHAGGGAGSAP